MAMKRITVPVSLALHLVPPLPARQENMLTIRIIGDHKRTGGSRTPRQTLSAAEHDDCEREDKDGSNDQIFTTTLHGRRRKRREKHRQYTLRTPKQRSGNGKCFLQEMGQWYKPPPMRTSPFIFLFLLAIVSTASAATVNCEEERTKKGQNAYETCTLNANKEKDNETLRDYRDMLDRERTNIRDEYRRRRENMEDARYEEDRDLQYREEDQDHHIQQLRNSKSAEDTIRLEQARLQVIRDERGATRAYFDRSIDVINAEETLKLKKLDRDYAEQEMQLRSNGRSTGSSYKNYNDYRYTYPSNYQRGWSW